MGKFTFCKVPNEEGTTFYNIKAEWFDPQFSISILENASAWEGLVDSHEIEQFSKDQNTSAEEYLKECQLAFSSDGPEKFVYSMKSQRNVEETVIVLTWKKIVDSDIKIKCGSICLQPVPLDCFIKDVWDVMDTMSAELTFTKRALEEIEYEKEKLFESLREYQELKLEMEKTLYAKFILILNAKKQKIEELEARLAGNVCGRTTAVDAPVDGVKMEPDVATDATISKSRKNAASSRGRGRGRGRARKKAVEVISPLDILPPSQSGPNFEFNNGGNNYNPAFDSDTDVDEPEPAGPSTSRWKANGGRVLSEAKREVTEPGTISETEDKATSITNVVKPAGAFHVGKEEVHRQKRDSGSSTDFEDSAAPVTRRKGDSGSSTDVEYSLAQVTRRKRDSGSSTDVDDFLAAEDELPLSMMPKRSKRSALSSWGAPGTSRHVRPVATQADVGVFNTQELLDDI